MKGAADCSLVMRAPHCSLFSHSKARRRDVASRISLVPPDTGGRSLSFRRVPPLEIPTSSVAAGSPDELRFEGATS
jgi:hypothetical protein